MDYTVSNYQILKNIDVMPTDSGKVALVTDKAKGGIFIYNPSEALKDNNGTSINGWVRQYSGDINALWFEAKGDGITDDRDAINNAIQYAASVQKDLFLPSGTYQINSGEILYNLPYGLMIDGASDFRIYGEKETVFRTHITNSGGINKWSLLLIKNCNNILIEGISFENNHVQQSTDANYTTTNEPRGIYLFGNTNKNITFRLNTFAGFYRAILLNGGKNTQILENTFLSPNGRDDSAFQISPEIEFKKQFPAVYIGVVSNKNGVNTDIVVKDNYAEGYSGSDISSTQIKRSMDGFYFGYANGALIENNKLLKFGVEAIFCFGFEKHNPNAEIKQTIIRNNYIDSTKPEGALTSINFGIRADGSNYLIEDNYICAGFGILCYGIENNRIAEHVTIQNNTYVSDSSLIKNWRPIFIQGYNKEVFAPARHYIVENNKINIKGITISQPLYIFTIADAEDLQIKHNIINVEDISNNSNNFVALYKFVKNCRNIEYGLERHNNNFDHITLEGITTTNSNLNYIALGTT